MSYLDLPAGTGAGAGDFGALFPRPPPDGLPVVLGPFGTGVRAWEFLLVAII